MNLHHIAEKLLAAAAEQHRDTCQPIRLITADPGANEPDLWTRLTETLNTMPPPPRTARIEIGQDLLDWLKEQYEPNPFPNPIAQFLGVPLVLSTVVGPWGWRALDHDGNQIAPD